MTVEQVSEEIVMYLEKNTDYLQRVRYVQTKIREIIESGIRERESISDNRSNADKNITGTYKETDYRTI